MRKVVKKLVAYQFMEEKYRYGNIQQLDKWEIYNYFANMAKGHSRRMDLFIPQWLVDYLKEIRLDNYNITLYESIRYFFRIFGVNDFVEELLIVDI